MRCEEQRGGADRNKIAVSAKILRRAHDQAHYERQHQRSGYAEQFKRVGALVGHPFKGSLTGSDGDGDGLIGARLADARAGAFALLVAVVVEGILVECARAIGTWNDA